MSAWLFSSSISADPPRARLQPSPLRQRLHRIGVAVLVTPLLVLTSPGVADASQTRNRADAGAGWLGRQLDAESHVITGEFGPVYGQTADVVLALSAAGVGRRAARQATTALEASVVGYTGGGDDEEYYAGAFAKLLLVAAAQGRDPRSFGRSARRDLVEQLQDLECRGSGSCARDDRGRFRDVSQFGDFSSVITQSLAVLGLERTTSTGASAASVRYLVDQQCSNGSFPQDLSSSTCTGDVDATGFAVQALVAANTPAARAAAEAAGRWLMRRQHRNGSFTGNDVRNANSTALAAQALDALDRGKRRFKAVRFLRSLQSLCGAPAALRGSLRYSRSSPGDRVLATAQAVPALAGDTLMEISQAGSTRTLPRLACSG